MERFIRYIYEYQEGKPQRSVGFVRIEKGDVQTDIYLHGRGLHLKKSARLHIYLICKNEEGLAGIYRGMITNINPSVNCPLRYTKKEIDKEYCYEKVCGILLKEETGNMYASFWEDEDFDVNSIVFCEMKEEITVFKDQGIRCYKIKREEIVNLARCEWRLANNAFLLHGYRNYHHLILLEEDGQCWIGVPGIFHRREARVAEGFGFTSFQLCQELDIDLSPGENDEDEKFGYWCRKVKRG